MIIFNYCPASIHKIIINQLSNVSMEDVPTEHSCLFTTEKLFSVTLIWRFVTIVALHYNFSSALQLQLSYNLSVYPVVNLVVIYTCVTATVH